MNHRLWSDGRCAPIRWALTTGVVLLTLVGCKAAVDIPDIVRTPDHAGDVEHREDLADGPIQLTLSGGAEVELDRISALNLRPGTDPAEGDLLLYGTEPDGPWFWSGPLLDDPRTGGQCAEIMAPALDEGGTIAFEIGLRLPKADDFDPFEVTDGQFTDPTQGFCLNERGEVTRYRS